MVGTLLQFCIQIFTQRTCTSVLTQITGHTYYPHSISLFPTLPFKITLRYYFNQHKQYLLLNMLTLSEYVRSCVHSFLLPSHTTDTTVDQGREHTHTHTVTHMHKHAHPRKHTHTPRKPRSQITSYKTFRMTQTVSNKVRI